jgi:hypothetical protein
MARTGGVGVMIEQQKLSRVPLEARGRCPWVSAQLHQYVCCDGGLAPAWFGVLMLMVRGASDALKSADQAAVARVL